MASSVERAEVTAMELLLLHQQQQHDNAATSATVLDSLAQICVEAHAVVEALDVADVTERLARVVTVMQESLRLVGHNVGSILQDEEKMHELCEHVKRADARALEVLQLSSRALLEDNQHRSGQGRDGDGSEVPMVVSGDPVGSSSAIVVSHFDEEKVRNVMVVAESVCTTMDHALGTITDDELALASQLSLDIAQKLLEAGQSLFTSLGDDERRKGRAADRGDRITIEEVEDEEGGGGTSETSGTVQEDKKQQEKTRSRQLKHAAVLRTYVMDLYTRTRKGAVEHPFLAGAVTATGLPFIGLAVGQWCFYCGEVLVAPKYSLLLRMLCTLDPCCELRRRGTCGGEVLSRAHTADSGALFEPRPGDLHCCQ
uniref:Uncharacterized protein n=1 Tax=Hyaloperonospora arabidopsidis (strain Emoy2) TaxID=559515 RepID=M4BD37_HYAAE